MFGHANWIKKSQDWENLYPESLWMNAADTAVSAQRVHGNY